MGWSWLKGGRAKGSAGSAPRAPPEEEGRVVPSTSSTFPAQLPPAPARQWMDAAGGAGGALLVPKTPRKIRQWGQPCSVASPAQGSDTLSGALRDMRGPGAFGTLRISHYCPWGTLGWGVGPRALLCLQLLFL